MPWLKRFEDAWPIQVLLQELQYTLYPQHIHVHDRSSDGTGTMSASSSQSSASGHPMTPSTTSVSTSSLSPKHNTPVTEDFLMAVDPCMTIYLEPLLKNEINTMDHLAMLARLSDLEFRYCLVREIGMDESHCSAMRVYLDEYFAAQHQQ